MCVTAGSSPETRKNPLELWRNQGPRQKTQQERTGARSSARLDAEDRAAGRHRRPRRIRAVHRGGTYDARGEVQPEERVHPKGAIVIPREEVKERIAQHFDAEAAKYEAESKEHGELAPFYGKNPDPALSKHPASPRPEQHCDSLSKALKQAAEDARGLAAEHRGMEKEAKK